MDGGGPKPKLFALRGTWSNANVIIYRVRSIPREDTNLPKSRAVKKTIGDVGCKVMRVCVYMASMTPK